MEEYKNNSVEIDIKEDTIQEDVFSKPAYEFWKLKHLK